jgi:hypothetical protein
MSDDKEINEHHGCIDDDEEEDYEYPTERIPAQRELYRGQDEVGVGDGWPNLRLQNFSKLP